jgi:hypothetical protein
VITGMNFTGITGVLFGSTFASYTVVSPTRIEAVVPQGASTAPIHVYNRDGHHQTQRDFVVTAAPPAISSFAPASGAPGSTVTIEGSALDGATSVTIGRVAAQFSIVSATRLSVTVPATATTGRIVVTTPGGTATSTVDFTVTAAPPTISSFSPASGAAGATVAIEGTALDGATGVTIGGVTAQFSIVSATRLNVPVPATATTGRIVVTTPGGTATSTYDFVVSTPEPAPTPPPPPPPPPAGGGSNGGGGGGGSSGIPPDLRVAVTPSAATAPAVGAELLWIVKVTSANGGGASDVRLDVALPAGFTVTRVVYDRGFGCSTSAAAVTCDVAWINASTSTTVQIFGTVGEAGAQKLTATVTSLLEPELDPSNNSVIVELPAAATAAPAPAAPTQPTKGVKAATKTVKKKTVSAVLRAPRLGGSASVGGTVVGVAPVFRGRATKIRYGWELCLPAGCLAIPGQHASKLTLGPGAAGYQIRFVVSATVAGKRVTTYSPRATVAKK